MIFEEYKRYQTVRRVGAVVGAVVGVVGVCVSGNVELALTARCAMQVAGGAVGGALAGTLLGYCITKAYELIKYIAHVLVNRYQNHPHRQ